MVMFQEIRCVFGQPLRQRFRANLA